VLPLIFLLILGLVSVWFGFIGLNITYETYKKLKRTNQVKWLILIEIISNFSTFRDVGAVLFGLFLILIYVLAFFGIISAK
jgi:hypothetical protein